MLAKMAPQLRDEADREANLFDLDAKYADVMPLEEAIAALRRIAGAPAPAPAAAPPAR